MAKSKKHTEPRKADRETGSKMPPGQPGQDAPSKGTLATAEEPREKYSKLDHATLVRNLKAVCFGLAIAIDQGGRQHGVQLQPPALSYQDVEELIPLTLHKIAIAAGWIAKQKSRDWLDYDHGFADLLGGDHGDLVEKSYKEWFLGLVADTLTDLEAKAENNLSAQLEYENRLGEQLVAWMQVKGEELRAAESKPSAKDKIDEYRKKVKPRLRSFEAIAKAATEKSKADGDNIVVTRLSVSRIYKSIPKKVGPAVRQAVANLLDEKVPCKEEDLLPPTPSMSQPSTARDTSESTKK